ncbi:MAG: substrate-binding domain-containing protein [Gemmatimonadota bacterium]|nr:substrate-binding domain-containing protein [Gemmatimonadota bacterium]
MTSPLRSSVRALRLQVGWSQTDLGSRVGLTRQGLAAIENGDAVPSTEVALRLARVFGVPVESLFRLDDAPPPSEMVEWSGLGGSLPSRVRLARVGGRRLAYGMAMAGLHGAVPADGTGEPVSDGGVRVRPFAERLPEPDLVVAGCDPAFGLVRERLRREHGLEVLWLRTGSGAALSALARGAVHVAGVHLEDPESGIYNGPWVERMIPFPSTRIAFAVWQQAILLAPGNPLGVDRLEDLARPDLRFLNREPGSGSRSLLERRLEVCGVERSAIPGFEDTAADGHETVARAIAAGAAHAGVAIRAVGDALDLAMLPLAEEPYELVVPDHFLDLPAVEALLGELRRPALRHQVEALTGYDGSVMGTAL